MEATVTSKPEPAPFDEASVRAFIADEYSRVLAAVALVAGSRAAAEDVVAEALARAWERSDRGERIESPAAWVTRVALNLTKSRLRRLRVEARHRPPLADVREPSGDRIDVERALAALPRREREVIVLRYYLDLDVAGIADTLSVTEGTVKTLLHRARGHLARTLGEDDEVT